MLILDDNTNMKKASGYFKIPLFKSQTMYLLDLDWEAFLVIWLFVTYP